MYKNKNLDKTASRGTVNSAFIETSDIHSLVTELYEEVCSSNGKRGLQITKKIKEKITSIEKQIKGDS